MDPEQELFPAFQDLDFQPSVARAKQIQVNPMQTKLVVNPCIKCQVRQAKYDKKCCQCHKHQLQYQCRLFFKKALPQKHEGVLVAVTGSEDDIVLCAVLMAVRNCYKSKSRKGIELQITGVLLSETDDSEEAQSFRKQLLAVSGIQFRHLKVKDLSSDQEALRAKDQLKMQFLVRARSCDDCAVSLVTDMLKGRNPLRPMVLNPFQGVIRADLTAYYQLSGLPLPKPLQIKQTPDMLLNATRSFLEMLQAKNSQTVRTVTKMGDKVMWV